MSQRNPQERAAGIAPPPGAPGGLPTGDEVYRADAARPTASVADAASALDADEAYGTAGMQALADEYLGKLSDLTDTLTDQASRYVGEGQQAVREHPAPALGGAFAFAFLIGVVLGYRS